MEQRKVCFYFLQSRCSYGERCYNRHVFPEPAIGINCYLIRHGESVYNKRLQVCAKEHGITAPTTSIGRDDFQLDATLIDSPLTEQGFQQANQLKEEMSDRQVELVFVSPLERALQTAQQIFGSRKDIKIIVVPDLTEIFSKVCDISSSIEEKRKRYPCMDFDLFKGRQEDWQAQLLQEYLLKGMYKHLASHKDKPENLLASYYLKQIKHVFPQPIQLSEACAKRVQHCVKYIKNICEKEYKNIAIVSHRRVLREITKSHRNPKGYAFENCEMQKFTL